MSTAYTIMIFRDNQGQWRWRTTRKGRVIFESSEGYQRVAGCLNSLESMVQDLFQSGSFRLSCFGSGVRVASTTHILKHCPGLKSILLHPAV